MPQLHRTVSPTTNVRRNASEVTTRQQVVLLDASSSWCSEYELVPGHTHGKTIGDPLQMMTPADMGKFESV